MTGDPVDRFMEDLTQQKYPGTDTPVRTSADEPSEDPLLAERLEEWRQMGRTYRMQGKPVTLYPIGALAKALDRKPGTIHSWERKGWIPKPKLRGPHKQGDGRKRLYTAEQIEKLVAAARICGLFEPNPPRITDTDFLDVAQEVLSP